MSEKFDFNEAVKALQSGQKSTGDDDLAPEARKHQRTDQEITSIVTCSALLQSPLGNFARNLRCKR